MEDQEKKQEEPTTKEYSLNEELDKRVAEYTAKARRRAEERIRKGIQRADTRILTTPLADEVEWMQKNVVKISEQVWYLNETIKALNEKIDKSSRDQKEILDRLTELWQFLIISMPLGIDDGKN